MQPASQRRGGFFARICSTDKKLVNKNIVNPGETRKYFSDEYPNVQMAQALAVPIAPLRTSFAPGMERAQASGPPDWQSQVRATDLKFMGCASAATRASSLSHLILV